MMFVGMIKWCMEWDISANQYAKKINAQGGMPDD
jgi:hypothetical protein